MATQEANRTVTFNPSAPDVFPASRFALSVTATDFCISFGRNRAVFGADGEGVGAGVEYTHAFMVSPTAAKQLAQVLAVTLAKYEAAFGRIPEDPSATKKLADLANAPAPSPASKKAAVKRKTQRAQ